MINRRSLLLSAPALLLPRARSQTLLLGAGGGGSGGGRSPEVVFNQLAEMAGTDDGAGNQGATFRYVYTPALLTAGKGGETQFRLTFLYGTLCTVAAASIIDVYGGRSAPTGNAYAFANPPTQVTLNGGATFNSGPALQQVSDWVSLPEPFDATKSFVVSGASANNATGLSSAVEANANSQVWFVGGNDASTQTPETYNFDADEVSLVVKIEIR